MIRSIFFHIPKAAGTSVKAAFYGAYGPDRCLKVWPIAHGGEIEVQSFQSYEPASNRELDCVMGHFNVKQFRSNPAVYADFCRSGVFALACFRDPFERLMSDYYYILNTVDHDRREQVLELGLEQYLERFHANEQTRWMGISGIHDQLAFDIDDEIAKKAVFILSTEVDRLLPDIMFKYTGHRQPVPRQNVGKGDAKDSDHQPSMAFRKNTDWIIK